MLADSANTWAFAEMKTNAPVLNKQQEGIKKFTSTMQGFTATFSAFTSFTNYLIYNLLCLSYQLELTNMDNLKHVLALSHILLCMGFALTCTAQVKPTPVEFLFGNKRIQGQTIVTKTFPQSRFGLFSLTTLAGDYTNKDKTNNEVVSNVQLNYDVFKGLKVVSGASFNSSKGFSPIVGLQYQYAKKVLFIINPTFDLNTQISFKTFVLIEYAPKKDKVTIYTRLQGMYVQNLATDTHERSFIVGRLGLFYKGFAVGVGFNQDYYGTLKAAKTNAGLFLHYKFM
ncbi:MAG: hypothetical protein SF053_16805 [Bacteroidia bacterium]|nr:hypothetical protein [Bacteroidia bacterium]